MSLSCQITEQLHKKFQKCAFFLEQDTVTNMEFTLNEVVSGDSLTLLQNLADDAVTLTLTDIPYDVVNRKSSGIRNFDKGNADDITFAIPDLVTELVRVTSGSMYVFCSTEQVSELRSEFVAAGLTTRLGIWEKTNPSPVNCQYLWMSSIECCVFARKKQAVFNSKYESPVWRYPVVSKQQHPTQKPLALFKRLIEISSNPGDIVLDPFIGSGTTAAAAVELGRDFYGSDLDPAYVKIANERIASTQLNLFPTK